MNSPVSAEQNGFAYFREHALHQAVSDGESWWAFDLSHEFQSPARCACGEWWASSHGYHWHDSGRCHTRERCTS